MTDFASTTDHHVAMATHTLQAAASELWRMRLNPQTADYVLREEGELLAALGVLQTLADDLRAARQQATRQLEVA